MLGLGVTAVDKLGKLAIGNVSRDTISEIQAAFVEAGLQSVEVELRTTEIMGLCSELQGRIA